MTWHLLFFCKDTNTNTYTINRVFYKNTYYHIYGKWGYGVIKNQSEIKLRNKKNTFNTDFVSRLELTQIECNDALQIIKSRDRVQTFHYIDPPYFNSDMGHYAGYTIRDFENLLQILPNLQGKFLLSCYKSDIHLQYAQQNNWQVIEIEMPTSASKNRKRKTELLTANYDIIEKWQVANFNKQVNLSQH